MANKKIKVSERAILSTVKSYLQLKGYKVWRINNAGTWNLKTQGYYFHGDKGMCDLIAINSVTKDLLFIECKSSTGKTTIEQLEFFKLIDNIKIIKGRIIRSVEELESLIT